MTEPNCDMPWDVYLDWLQDQGNEDLRFIEPGLLVVGSDFTIGSSFFINLENTNGEGHLMMIMFNRNGEAVPSYRGEGITCNGGFGDGVTNAFQGVGITINPLNMKIGNGEHERA